jgi:hypothetical protein
MDEARHRELVACYRFGRSIYKTLTDLGVSPILVPGQLLKDRLALLPETIKELELATT